ncbi:uncharacterized protein B0I36DRAFT_114461 [Microdochium trichocladiopsis]|uniref:Zn(2)-C6 fungal-type domain-containing protein n=1 Tax=Microdochium trichocladiopsis TaxID=1682393 RepID=A0A9P8Y8U8_9PEZI|nr:uncharacterized protein B0I36DRAFT_114461 [Microdochium trichocladiopsis]KAH7030825.1 hypothetical protein B0I36DRAFT_114461 [Microdochium trichocladiopsis]
MSGSSPLPPNPHRDAVYRDQRPFDASRQDAYGGDSGAQGRSHGHSPAQFSQLPPMQIGPRSAIYHDTERRPSPYAQPEDSSVRHRPYSPQLFHSKPEPRYPGPSTASSGSLLGSTFPSVAHQQGGQEGADASSRTSPKSQRKTKGHVASACVPCKRAHLRCDAQRPCSRCLSNGKDDACVDVQHKKRGRPRLRDDRESRFETARYAQPDEPLSRRSSLYSPAISTATSYDDPLRRAQSYRAIKSQPNEPEATDYQPVERATFPHVHHQQPSVLDRDQDPVAYLNLDLSIARASEPFFEMLGSRDVLGRRLVEIVSAHERDRLSALQSSLQAEQAQREPNYLPPIFLREETDRLVRSLPLGGDALGRFRLDRIETITFMMANGQLKPCLTRIGLVKEGSIYLVVLRPDLPAQRPQGMPQSYGPRGFPPPAQTGPRHPGAYNPPRDPMGHPASGHSYGGSSQGLPATNQSRPEGHGGRPYLGSLPPRADTAVSLSGHTPRSELAAHRPTPHEYQLPPIRMTPQLPPQSTPMWQRDERPGRVDIGKIIDGPTPPRRE